MWELVAKLAQMAPLYQIEGIMKQRMTDFYMDVAERSAQMSRANKLKVGAVIVKDDNIISFSWNGTPAGWDNNCEIREYPEAEDYADLESLKTKYPYVEQVGHGHGAEMTIRYRLITRPEVIHAERNCLDKLIKTGNANGTGASMFITHSPCMECAKSIFGAGITRVFYRDHYRDDSGVKFLKQCGVQVDQLGNSDV